MLIVILIPATILAGAWLFLQTQVTREDWIAAASNTILDNKEKIDALRDKDAKRAEALRQYRGRMRKLLERLWGGSEKEIAKLRDTNEAIRHGSMKKVGILDLPGYVLLRMFPGIRSGSVYRDIMERCVELYGKKYAPNRAAQLLARMLAYPMLGVAFCLALGALMLGLENTTNGIAVLSIGTLLVLVLDYALYDKLKDKVKKRRAEISRQFPNVVSKLALLMTSGMIMQRAWRETAQSLDLVLYREMQLTADELSNLVEPITAFTNFINRCNTKETTKLGSALIQSHKKSNNEIGRLLRTMAYEAWQERRHTAKRDSEAANAKLMIPTMLLFGSIIVMILVPIVISFQDF